MTSHQVVLGIDCGTQSMKAILYHLQSQKIVARASAPLELDPITVNADSQNSPASPVIGRAEQHPHKWIKALHICFQSLAPTIQRHNYQLCGLGVSGQQHGMVPLDKDLQVIRPAKLWCDVEAAVEAKEFTDWASDVMSYRMLAGRKVHWSTPPGFTAPKVLWMKKNEPELWERVRWIMLPHDYVTLCLSTGLGYDLNVDCDDSHFIPSIAHLDVSSVIPTTDLGDASGTGFLHPEKSEYVPELTKLIHDNFEECLPRILSPNEISGYLSKQWNDILLGKATKDDEYLDNDKEEDRIRIPISVGTGDNMASALGCKCIKTGNVVLSLGTSGTIFGVSESSQFSKEDHVLPTSSLSSSPSYSSSPPLSSSSSIAPFRDATGRYLPLVCVMSCTGVLNCVLKNWCSMDHEEAIVLAKDVPVGCHGLTFLPYLGGERTPDWPHATGALLGLTPQNMVCMGGGHTTSTKTSAGILYRCAMEGITFLLADALEEMLLSCRQRQQQGKDDNHDHDQYDNTDTPSIMVVGGGSKNPLWRQMLADVLGVNLLFPTEPESAALGAAFQAGAVATGVNMIQFIDQQPVPVEDVTVTPTTDPTTLQMYRHARQRYREYSTKLFSS